MELARIKLSIQTTLVRSAVVTALAVMPLSTRANEQTGYWYGGVGIGRSYNDAENSNLNASLVPPGVPLCVGFPCQTKDSGTGYKLFAGYQFHELLGVEAEYTRLSNTLEIQSVDSNTVPSSILSASQDSQIFSLRGILTKRIISPISISAVLGVGLWQSDLDAGLVGPGFNLADSKKSYGLSLNFGARINYDFNDSLRLRGSWDRYTNLGKSSIGNTVVTGATAPKAVLADTVHTDTDLFSLELVYRFR